MAPSKWDDEDKKNMPKDIVVGWKNYNIKKNFYDALANAFDELKVEINGRHGWNRPIEQLDGLTLRLLNNGYVQINHAKYIVANRQTLEMKEKVIAEEFITELVKMLKKKFRKLTGVSLDLKEHEKTQDIQLFSKLTPDKSYSYGGPYREAMCRYMLTTSTVFKVSSGKMKVTDD